MSTNLTEIELVDGELRIRVARTAFAPMAPASYPHVSDTAAATPREDTASDPIRA